MASYDEGKDRIIEYILSLNPRCILDVGACDGKWAKLLRGAGYEGNIDAVEIFKPNAAKILDLYDNVFVGNIADYGYKFHQYDIIIFGDVIEHMEVNEAQYVLDYARGNCGADIIVGVPFQYKQGPLYGNPWERHIQDDLTPELMAERYPGLELMFQAAPDYAYYHKKGGEL